MSPLSDRESMRAIEKCGSCGHVSGPPEFVWVQHGEKLKSRWHKGTASHFEVRRRTKTSDRVYCTHGSWYGDLIYDAEGKAVELRHQHGAIKVVGIKPVMPSCRKKACKA